MLQSIDVYVRVTRYVDTVLVLLLFQIELQSVNRARVCPSQSSESTELSRPWPALKAFRLRRASAPLERAPSLNTIVWPQNPVYTTALWP